MSARPLQLLVIDGLPETTARLSDLLAAAGEAQITAGTLDAMLPRLVANDADAVFYDLTRPGDGLAALARIQADAPYVPLIAILAAPDEALTLAASRAGAQDIWLPGMLNPALAMHLLRTAIARHRLREDLRSRRVFYEQIVQSVLEGILLEDATGCIAFSNQAIADMLGYTPDELIGQHWSVLVAREALAGVASELRRRPQGVASRYETTLLAKDGRHVPVIVSARPVLNAGRYSGVLSVFTDISARKAAEEELRSLSLHDSLTGLYNRRGFRMLAEQHLRMARRGRRTLSLLFADLDELKVINDTLGHARGDEALMEAGEVLREVFRDSDIIARLGGDEFGVVPLEASATGALTPLQRLQACLDERNALAGRTYRLSFSVGVAVFDPADPCSIDELLDRADQAMYQHKRQKRALRAAAA